MSYFLEPYILFVLGCIIFRDSLADPLSIRLILLFLLIISLFILCKNTKARIFLCLFSILVATFFPAVLGFLPACLYFSVYEKKYTAAGCFTIPFFITLFDSFQPTNTMFIFLAVFSGYLAINTREKNQLTTQVKKLRDDSVEHEMILKMQNTQLLENQNDQIYIATLQERNRIAREIHDNVGHMLSSSILQIGALLAICKDETLKPLLANLKDTLNEAMTNIRNSVHDLHDDSIDMKDSIEQLCNDFSFCSISLQYDAGKKIPKEIKYSFISITKEALNNIIKHSNATKVHIMVKEHPGFLQLVIEDNGTAGNLLTNYNGGSNGIGLTNMQSRVKALKGIINFDTEHGFRILISIPK